MNEIEELNEAEKSLGIGDEFMDPMFRLLDSNKEIVCKNIDKIDLSKFTTSNDIEIFVEPSENDIEIDWPSFLNSITDRGYNIKFKIYALGGSINDSIETEDIIIKILKCKDRIRNKEKIKFGYARGPAHLLEIQEYSEIEEALDLCAKSIENKDYSPLEKLVAAYKITVGIFLGNNNSEELSYDKYSSIAMFPKVKPVCQSYTQVFEALCKKLNIKCFNKTLYADAYHSTDIVEIEDEKYNIKGRYFIDITLAATMLNAYIMKANENGKVLDDNLPIANGLFCIGKNGMNKWSQNYKHKQWESMNLSEEGISNEKLANAMQVVNDATVIDVRKR